MNRIIGKCIAGTMGFLAFGPAGLLFGLVLGHAFDRGLWRALQLSGPEAVPMMRAQFFETSFTLLGFVAKAMGGFLKPRLHRPNRYSRNSDSPRCNAVMRLSILRRGPRLALIPHRRLRASLNVWGHGGRHNIL